MTLYTIQYRRWGRLLSLPRQKSFENKRKWHSKGDNEKGQFNEEWTVRYLFSEVGPRPTCLICSGAKE